MAVMLPYSYAWQFLQVQPALDGHAPASADSPPDASVKIAILQLPLATDTRTRRRKEELEAQTPPAGHEILVRSNQPASNSTDSNASLATPSNCGLETGLPPGIKAALEQVLEQHQSTEAATAKSSGPQLFEKPPPLLKGPAWLAWLPDGSATGQHTSICLASWPNASRARQHKNPLANGAECVATSLPETCECLSPYPLYGGFPIGKQFDPQVR